MPRRYSMSWAPRFRPAAEGCCPGISYDIKAAGVRSPAAFSIAKEESPLHAPTLAALEFSRIQDELAAHAACQLGKELAQQIEPLPTVDQIRRVQRETTEAKLILSGNKTMPFGGIQDIRLHVERAAIGGVLRPEQLTMVADTIYGCRQLHRFLQEQKTAAPLLGSRAQFFGRFDEVEQEIRRCIERGTVSTRASQALKQIRGEMASLESAIQSRLNGLLRQYRQHLQEALITTRNGRYVIPVKAGSKALVPGAVHGASASGSSVFVEPDAVRHLSDQLETWRAMEEAEIEQVLIILSGHVAAHGDGLKVTLEAVAELDLIAARARLSLAWDGEPVAWNQEGLINLKGARHPLLGKKAVGNRIRMSAQSRMLIITGPNTGGKTLLLKTLGLLVILAQCGLHIPVEEGSTVCFFTDVFADIGDHQSLEQSLSTFSGHIANVAPMLDHAGPQTMVLLDELGAGTDPHEGTGLGIALLEAFLKQGAYTLATTHLREIKEFARATPGCAYAGMGFDGETLRPTYHLLYGTLGESHGLEIAARAGLRADVVQRARRLVHGEAPAVAGTATPVESPASFGTTGPVESPALFETTAPAEIAAIHQTALPPDLTELGMVTAAGSPGRCLVWHEGRARELAVSDVIRRLHPAGLVPGDRVRLRAGQAAEAAPRQNVLVSRDADTMAETVVAANLTRLLILLSCRQPDFHATVLARHLLYAERQGVAPIICLTKADLVPPDAAEQWLAPLRATGYEATLLSTARGRGLDRLMGLLQGQVTGVIANPGAGKSTLLGALAQEAATGGVPDRPGSLGRETAQPRALRLSSGTWLIDLPGLRQLGVWKPDLAGGFREFALYSGRCQRLGCLHLQEPGCGVRQAVADGQLPRARYEQYQQLLQLLRLHPTAASPGE